MVVMLPDAVMLASGSIWNLNPDHVRAGVESRDSFQALGCATQPEDGVCRVLVATRVVVRGDAS